MHCIKVLFSGLVLSYIRVCVYVHLGYRQLQQNYVRILLRASQLIISRISFWVFVYLRLLFVVVVVVIGINTFGDSLLSTISFTGPNFIANALEIRVSSRTI